MNFHFGSWGHYLVHIRFFLKLWNNLEKQITIMGFNFRNKYLKHKLWPCERLGVKLPKMILDPLII